MVRGLSGGLQRGSRAATRVNTPLAPSRPSPQPHLISALRAATIARLGSDAISTACCVVGVRGVGGVLPGERSEDCISDAKRTDHYPSIQPSTD